MKAQKFSITDILQRDSCVKKVNDKPLNTTGK